MTTADKIVMVQMLVDNDDRAEESVVMAYLSLAAEKMLRRLYPYDPTRKDMLAAYDVTQCELAARLFLRRGGEGEQSHSDNGVSRSYSSVDDEDILSRLTPYAKVVMT